MKFSLRSLHTFIPPLVLALCTACVAEATLTLVGVASFNPRLRADIEALTPQQQVARPGWIEIDGRAYYSDGGATRSEIISDLTHSMIDPNRTRELRASRCLFIEWEGYPILSYEATFNGFYVDAETNIDTIGLCGGILVHPTTREVLSVNGTLSTAAFNLGTLSVGLVANSGNETERNPYATCDEVVPTASRTVTLGSDLNAGLTGTWLPLCLVAGSPNGILSEDTSYRLEVINSDTLTPFSDFHPDLSSEPHDILPHLKVVWGRRSIVRPLTFSATEFDTERGRWVHTFVWAVPSVDDDGLPNPAGAFWQENFGPSVLVESAAFFLQVGSTPAPEGSVNRDYLAIDKLRVSEIGDIGAQVPIPFDSGCDLDAAGDPDGDDSFYLAPCEITATPTYALTPDLNGRMTQKVEWQVQFYTENETDPIPVDPGEAFFIEFRLQSPVNGSQSGALMVAPHKAEMGNVPIGTTQRSTSAMSLRNVGHAGVLVEAIEIQGSDASAFDFELPVGTTLPFVLPLGRSVEIDLLVTTTKWDLHSAELVVTSSDAGQVSQVAARGELEAFGVAAELAVIPRSLTLLRGAGADPARFQRNLLVMNGGSIALERRDFTLSGRDRGLFTVVRSVCNSKILTPPSASCRIDAGGDEMLTIEYHPFQAGAHEASLSIATSAGSDEIPVFGYCEGTCYYPPPDPKAPTVIEGPRPEVPVDAFDDPIREPELVTEKDGPILTLDPSGENPRVPEASIDSGKAK